MDVEGTFSNTGYRATMFISAEELDALIAQMPRSSADSPAVMGIIGGSHHCVQVQRGGQALCQKTIYDNSFWAHVRALAIMKECGGDSVSMISGKCSPENTCP